MCTHLVSHFVKLVDAADALVSQNKGSSFKHHLTGQVILHDSRSQADTRGTSASGQPMEK